MCRCWSLIQSNQMESQHEKKDFRSSSTLMTPKPILRPVKPPLLSKKRKSASLFPSLPNTSKDEKVQQKGKNLKRRRSHSHAAKNDLEERNLRPFQFIATEFPGKEARRDVTEVWKFSTYEGKRMVRHETRIIQFLEVKYFGMICLLTLGEIYRLR